MQNHGIVVDHIGGLRVIALDDINHVRPAISQGRTKDRWVAPRVEQIAAWIVQRQAQAEHQTFFHFGDALLYLLRREQVQPSELIVRAEIAPGGTLGSFFSSVSMQPWLSSSYYSQYADFKTIPGCAPRRHEEHEEKQNKSSVK